MMMMMMMNDPKSFFNFAETWYSDTLCQVNIFVFPGCRQTKWLWVNEGRLALPRSAKFIVNEDDDESKKFIQFR